jgi:hypothetical protein
MGNCGIYRKMPQKPLNLTPPENRPDPLRNTYTSRLKGLNLVFTPVFAAPDFLFLFNRI